jgi:hypothetical protein
MTLVRWSPEEAVKYMQQCRPHILLHSKQWEALRNQEPALVYIWCLPDNAGLWIQFCGSGTFIPDPGYRVEKIPDPDPHQRILSIFNPKNLY